MPASRGLPWCFVNFRVQTLYLENLSFCKIFIFITHVNLQLLLPLLRRFLLQLLLLCLPQFLLLFASTSSISLPTFMFSPTYAFYVSSYSPTTSPPLLPPFFFFFYNQGNLSLRSLAVQFSFLSTRGHCVLRQLCEMSVFSPLSVISTLNKTRGAETASSGC